MGLVKTPWPEAGKSQYKQTKEALEHLWYLAQTIDVRGLRGKRRNPYLVASLGLEIQDSSQELVEILKEALDFYQRSGPGDRPYWIEALEIMITDLETLSEVYCTLIRYHHQGNLPAARFYSEAALEGLSYISQRFTSIPYPGSRQTSPIKKPDVPEAWREIENLLEDLP